jgi:hypothetical protein
VVKGCPNMCATSVMFHKNCTQKLVAQQAKIHPIWSPRCQEALQQILASCSRRFDAAKMCNNRNANLGQIKIYRQRPILNFTPGPQGITSPLGVNLAPRGELCPLGVKFTPSFTPRGEHSLLFRRMEG